MPTVSTFCARCGEAIETEVPEEARAAGRAELTCPACRLDFLIAPARRPGTETPPHGPGSTDKPRWAPGVEPTAKGAPKAPAVEPTRADPSGTTTPYAGVSTQPKPINFKALSAGLMLLFVAVIGGYMGFLFATQDDIVHDSIAVSTPPGVLDGTITDGAGRPVENATIEIMNGPSGANETGRTTTTDASGTYAFSDLAPGVYDIRIEVNGTVRAELTTPAFGTEWATFDGLQPFGDITLPEADASDGPLQVDDMAYFRTMAQVLGALALVGTALVAAGGIAAMRRRAFGLAVAGSIVGIVLGFPFLVGSVLAATSLVLVIVARKDFGRRSAR